MIPIRLLLDLVLLAVAVTAGSWIAAVVNRRVAARRSMRWRPVTGVVARVEHVEGVVHGNGLTYVSRHYAFVEYPGPSGETVEVRIKVPKRLEPGTRIGLLVDPRRPIRAALSPGDAEGRLS